MKAALATLLSALSCVHVAKVGDACKDGEAYCGDTATALACRAGHLQPFACSGPKGCAVDSARAVSCDQSSGAQPAGACFPEYEGRAQCGAAPGAYLQCLGGQWVQLACNPPGTTCHVDAGGLSCL